MSGSNQSSENKSVSGANQSSEDKPVFGSSNKPQFTFNKPTFISNTPPAAISSSYFGAAATTKASTNLFNFSFPPKLQESAGGGLFASGIFFGSNTEEKSPCSRNGWSLSRAPLVRKR